MAYGCNMFDGSVELLDIKIFQNIISAKIFKPLRSKIMTATPESILLLLQHS